MKRTYIYIYTENLPSQKQTGKAGNSTKPIHHNDLHRLATKLAKLAKLANMPKRAN